MTTLQPGTQVEADPVDDYDVANKKTVDDAVGNHETSVTEGETGPTIGTRVGIRAAFVWWSGIGDNISGHGYYQVQMATDSGFTSIVDDVETKTNWATFDGLTTGVTYYWRVRGIDAAGNTSDWATTVSDSGDQVVEDDLGDDSVSTVKIQDLAVDTAKIKNAAITTAKIGNAEITTAKIANLAVDTAKIASAAITNAKIDNLAVTEGKIANLAVDTGKIKNLAVETLKIADLNVTIDKEASPVGVDGAGGTSTGFGVTTTETTVHSHTINVPAWAGNAGLMTIAHLSADNSTATGGFLQCRAIIAGSPGGENSSRFVGAGEWGGTVTASAQREISSPGSTISCGTVASHSGSGTWSSGSNNADADTLATFTR